MPYQPRATLDNPYGPEVGFRTEDVLPPSAYYINPDDRIIVWAVTDLPNIQLTLSVRLLTPEGLLKILYYNTVIPAVYNWQPVIQLNPVEGYILGALLYAASPPRGQCYTSILLERGAGPTQGNSGLVLLQGYTNQFNPLSYPTSPLQDSFNGRGSFVTVNASAGPGANFVLTVPQYTLWRLQSLNFSLATSAAGSAREVFLIVKDASGVQVGFWGSSTTQPISTSYTYGFSPGGQNVFGGNIATIAGPTDLWLPTNATLQTYVSGIQPTDQLTAIAGTVEEWLGF